LLARSFSPSLGFTEQPSGLELFKEKIMFISYAEKTELKKAIKSLQNSVSDMGSEILYLKGKVKALSMNVTILQQIVDHNRPLKKVKTPEQKAKQAEYMRRYKAKKKAEKAAQLAKAVA
jgi:hypothetical protein